ncbi:uncharacterized protein J4E88_009769 [Alternaria novae-zelandiae]|uniref:uncharacterized protein n=1 Tax=Alternaria novae-zelandiae TaxID=430562 RepID=UPI0020C1C2C6|nr:uncharacterized protein J4E88_009769 [Alternaria novae-zelandiae]KAI4670677.1 hypothetical protein J4E88_009769 [Alternaria novae-zelandiae]
MRAHYLVAGLIGLAGLAFAAPTPESTAVSLIPTSQPSSIATPDSLPRCNMAEPANQWLMTICGSHGSASTIPNTWPGVCGVLTGGVAYEVTSTAQVPELMCKFYDDSNFCNSDFLIATIMHHEQIPPHLGKRIKYVQCGAAPTSSGSGGLEVRDDDASPVLEAEDIKHAEADDALPIHDLNPTQPEDTSSWSPSPCMNPGSDSYFLIVCGGGNANWIPNNWMNACVRLSDTVGHHVGTVIQNAHIMCKYYDDSNECNSDFKAYSNNLSEDIELFSYPPQVGNQLKYVMCKQGQWRRGVASSSACMNPDASHYFLSICGNGNANNIPNNWMNACVSLTSTVGYHVETLTQNARITCRYYDDSNECNGNIEGSSTTYEKEESFTIPPDAGNRIKYVMCKIGQWRRDVGGIEAREVDVPSSSEIFVAPEIVVAPDTDVSPSTDVLPAWACMNPSPDNQYLVVCSHGVGQLMQKKLLGNCLKLNSDIAYNVDSFIQDPGLRCKFYNDRHSDCKGEPIYTAQTLDKQHLFKIDAKYGTRFKYVWCHKGDHQLSDVPALEARVADTSLEAPSFAVEEPSGLIARLISDTGYAFEYQENFAGLCIKLPDTVSRHLTHAALVDHTLCRFYESGCFTLFKPLFTAKSEAPYTKVPVPSDVSKKITHAVCGPSTAPHNEIDARADATPLEASPAAASETTASWEYIARIFSPTSDFAIMSDRDRSCLKFEGPFSHNVTKVNIGAHTLCVFYDNDCSLVKYPVFTVSSTTEQFVSRDVPADVSKNITHVICGFKNHDAIETRADATTAYSGTLARIFSSTSRHAILRENSRACVMLRDRVANSVTSVTVAAHTLCVFYDNDCTLAVYPVFSVSTDKEQFTTRDVPGDVGKKITHVLCGKKDGYADVNARADDSSLEPAAQKTKMARVLSDTADLYIYDDNDADCVALSKHVANDVVGVQLEANILCVFYTNACNIAKFPIFRASNVGPGTLHVDIPGYTGRDISHVACGKKHTLDAEINAWAATTPIVDARAETTPTVDAQAVTTPIVDSTVLTTLHLEGPEIARVFSKTAMFGINDEDANTCNPLGDSIANDLFAVAVHENVLCRFWENSCDVAKDPLYQLHSNKGDVASKVPSDIGKQLTHFMCMRTEPQAAIFTPEELEILADIGYMAFFFSSTSQLGINDWDAKKCIPLGDSVAHDLFAVAVPQNVSCSFYKDGCDVSKSPIFLVASNQGGGGIHDVPSEIGKSLTHVICMRVYTQPHAEIIAREEGSRSNVALITSAASADNTPDPATDLTNTQIQYPRDGYSPVDLPVGDLFTCSYEQTDSCWIMDALNDCLEFPTNTAHNVMILEQAKGTYCWYYNKPGCKDSDEVFHHTSAPGNPTAFIGTFFKDLASVVCGGPGVTSELEVIPHDHAIEKVTAVDRPIYADDITKRDSLPTDSAPSWTLPRVIRVGEVFACSEDFASGCWYINAQNKCTDFPAQVAHKSQFIMQAKGTWCKYYLEAGCSHEAWQYVSSPTDHTTFGVKTNLVASVECQASKATANEVTKRDWPPGSTTVCHQAHYQFCTDNAINAIQQCANFAPADQGPISIIQYGGAYCKWYRDFGCGGGEDKSPMSIDSRGGEQWIDDLSVENRFKSVKCETFQW